MGAWVVAFGDARDAAARHAYVAGLHQFLAGNFQSYSGISARWRRILRGIIWWITGDAIRATRIATRIGQVIAVGFIVLGVVRFFSGAGFDGLWIAFIGWFLLEAAGASRAQVEINERLRGVNAGDLVERDCLVVDGHDNLQNFVNNYLLRMEFNVFLRPRRSRHRRHYHAI